MANRATGKGYENETFYENIKFHFLGIENIHVMRSSLSKLIESKDSVFRINLIIFINLDVINSTCQSCCNFLKLHLNKFFFFCF